MRVILDFPGRRRAFQAPHQVISADNVKEVPEALAAIAEALARGCHVAGWLGYELGYALEPRLTAIIPANVPLLRLGVFDAPAFDVPGPAGRAYAGPPIHDWDEAAYAARFTQVKALIAAGDIYQANLSYRARFFFAGDALALYERLRATARAPWCGFVDDGQQQIVSLSPELFFELSSSGAISARPMKGTAPRADFGGDDAATRAALAASAKDRSENLMIVDLIRNDLGRVAETGSVTVKALFAVETYPTLHTMVSTVSARKRAGAGIADILRALFPCGSVTGAPKIRAMEILRQLEDAPRGAYCGAIGYFEPASPAREAQGGEGARSTDQVRRAEGVINFAAQFNVAIRTLTITGSSGTLGLGGGVVQDSQSAAEYAECRLKARFFEEDRPPLYLIETLKWDGDFVRVEAHLARMANSARVFKLAFDRAEAVAALGRAVSGHAGPLRVRLTLDESGRHEAAAAPLETNPRHWTYTIASSRVSSTDLLQQHKTNWRALYESEAALADEVLFCNEKGELAEGARSNIFVQRDGVLLTPPLTAGALNGCLRAELIALGRAREARLMPADLKNAGLYCGNSLRGLIKAIPL